MTPLTVAAKLSVLAVGFALGLSITAIVSLFRVNQSLALSICVPRETFFILSVAVGILYEASLIFFRLYHPSGANPKFGPALSVACCPASTIITSGRWFCVEDPGVRS